MRIDEKIQAAIIIALLAFGVLTVTPIILGDRIVEPFSELGILGPNMKLGDYPREVTVGEEIDLYLYLGNHEGRPTYYRVLVKVGTRGMNVTETEPYSGVAVASYEHVLVNESNYTRPITLSIRDGGMNRRLVFELHKYDVDKRGFVYDGIWAQLWLNVTEPS